MTVPKGLVEESGARQFSLAANAEASPVGALIKAFACSASFDSPLVGPGGGSGGAFDVVACQLLADQRAIVLLGVFKGARDRVLGAIGARCTLGQLLGVTSQLTQAAGVAGGDDYSLLLARHGGSWLRRAVGRGKGGRHGAGRRFAQLSDLIAHHDDRLLFAVLEPSWEYSKRRGGETVALLHWRNRAKGKGQTKSRAEVTARNNSALIEQEKMSGSRCDTRSSSVYHRSLTECIFSSGLLKNPEKYRAASVGEFDERRNGTGNDVRRRVQTSYCMTIKEWICLP